mmetsp:Transcript_1492/g.2993  ORF Transcript_1492/g.2993 Transcript_1492/m.2993 type:complete len:284 (-) Transcript_1492:690-1541(-)
MPSSRLSRRGAGAPSRRLWRRPSAGCPSNRLSRRPGGDAAPGPIIRLARRVPPGDMSSNLLSRRFSMLAPRSFFCCSCRSAGTIPPFTSTQSSGCGLSCVWCSRSSWWSSSSSASSCVSSVWWVSKSANEWTSRVEPCTLLDPPSVRSDWSASPPPSMPNVSCLLSLTRPEGVACPLMIRPDGVFFFSICFFTFFLANFFGLMIFLRPKRMYRRMTSRHRAIEMKIMPTPNALMTANTEGPSGDAAKRMVPRVLMKQLKEIRSAVVITISTFLSAFAFGWVAT